MRIFTGKLAREDQDLDHRIFYQLKPLMTRKVNGC